MNASRLVLTVAGTIGALAAGIGIGAALYASVEPATTTTTVVQAQSAQAQAPQAPSAQAQSAGSAERTAATVPGGLSVNAIYQRTHTGVVDITVAVAHGEAEGSGWVYDTRGDIVTNQHVVSGGGSITVTFPDGASYSGKLVGTDSSTDLAVIRVSAPASKLTPLALGNSDGVQVGDPVVAIGSPFGLPGTVTSGIVSALHRSIQAPNDFTIGNSIQTDAPINHGNSGGPLLDGAAQVIGVNAQIQSDSGGNDGVGFAIPSNTVRSIVAQLVAGKSVQHAYLGVSVRDSRSPVGAELAHIFPGTPAAKAGLTDGDVVTAIDGKAIGGDSDVSEVLGRLKPGDTITVTYSRDGHTATARVILTSRPS